MGQPPLTFLEKRWASGYGSGNQLLQAATQNSDRKNVPFLDYDVYRNVSTLGRRTLLSLGRYLMDNCSPLRGSVLEMARLTASVLTRQFGGADTVWGKQTEDVLREEDKFIDIRGYPFSMDVFRRILVISLFREGELGVILADVDGEPRLQCIPSHRIGSRSQSGNVTLTVEGGPFDGAKLIDGVIVDDYGAALGYRVYDERGVKFDDVSSNDMLLIFIPEYVEQLRGVSVIGRHAWEAWDVNEGRQFELINQKLRASYAVSVHNETGTIDTAKAVFGSKATANDSTNAAQSLPTQMAGPGQITYMKAGTGQKIEFPENNNPGPNVMAFQDEVLRSMLHGMGWSFDFSHNPSKVGGAQMRVVIEKINASIAEIRILGLQPAERRITGWRVAKHIKAGRLAENGEWYKWNFQGGAELTADEKYTSDVTIQEVRAGLRSPKKAVERFGDQPWEEVQDDAIDYEKRLQERCKAEGVNPDRIVQLTPNGNPQQMASGSQRQDGEQD